MARVSFEFKKGDLVWIGLIVVLLSVGFGVAAWVDKPQYHDDAEIKVYFNGSDRSLSEAMAMIDAGGGFGLAVGGGSMQSVQVVGTSNIQAGTGWADMSNMVIAMNVGGDVLLMFSGNIEASGNTNVMGTLRFLVDGVARHQMATEAGDGAWQNDFSMHWIEKGLSSGTHTFKVQWKGTNSNVQQDGATYPRVFSAIELSGLGGSGVDIVTAVVNNADIPSASLTLLPGEWLVEVNVAVTSGGSVIARNILIDGVDAGDVKGTGNRDGDTSGFGTAFSTVNVASTRSVVSSVSGALTDDSLRNSVFSVKAIRVGS